MATYQGKSYDPDNLCQDDHEWLTQSGPYAPTLAMILEDHGQVKYVRVLEAGASEPTDSTVEGDVQKWLNFWYSSASLVDTHTFMEAWNQRRADSKAS